MSFFRLLRNLGYREQYLICDLPVMCALQRFYLRNVFPSDANGPPATPRWFSGENFAELQAHSAQHHPSLFIATWSLSETPPEVRSNVAPEMGGFRYVLLAYQRTFGTYDNVEYFTSLQKSMPQFQWQHFECPVYRIYFYLIVQITAYA